MSNKEYDGSFPIRQDITVLPSDDPKKLRLAWVYLEGEIILKSQNGFYTDFIFDEVDINGRKVKLPKGRLCSFDDIKEGDKVYSTGYDGEVVKMTVESMDFKNKTALGKVRESCYGNLSFNKDKRYCWICSGYMFVNEQALANFNGSSN